jgi:hypothetical protein
MGEWKEFEIKDFQGIQKSRRVRDKNACQELINLDTRGVTGDLEQRNGYALKYPAPSHSRLSNLTILSFENFFTQDTEITVAVGKATLNAETGTPQPSDINVLVLFTRPYWNGSMWVDDWQWLNEMFLTIQSENATNQIIVSIDAPSGNYTGWAIHNVTKNETVKIIKRVSEFFELTKYTDWEEEDIILAMKNYIPYTELLEMYNVTVGDIVFHKVLDELRIGFGGYENRMGLSVCFRQTYLQLSGFDFGSYTPAEVQAFAKIDGLILDPYTALTEVAKMDLIELPTGGLSAKTYYFKLSAVLDTFNEVMLNADISIEIADTKGIQVDIKLKLGSDNKRITSLKLYMSTDDDVYQLAGITEVRKAEYNGAVESLGTGFVLFTPGATTAQQFHSPNNDNAACVLTSGDPNTRTGWGWFGSLAVIAGTQSDYALELSGGAFGGFAFYEMDNMSPNTSYNVSLWARMKLSTQVMGISLGGNTELLNVTASWQQFDVVLATGTSNFILDIGSDSLGTVNDLQFDLVSVTKEVGIGSVTSDTKLGAVLEDAIGSEPTLNYVRSWDYAIVSQGKTFMISPYTDRRTLNTIFFSARNDFLASMYDVLPGLNYEVENFDGNEMLAISILTNMNILAIKQNSSQIVDTQTGATAEILAGYGIVNKRSLVDFGDISMWANEYDLIGFSRTVRNLSEGTIREDYRAIVNKNNIIAVRDEKDNSYMFFDGVQFCYILTKRGWIKAEFAHKPEKYASAKDGTVWFLDDNKIYNFDNSYTDHDQTVRYAKWKSVPFDIALIGEGITQQRRFYVRSVFLVYLIGLSAPLNVKVYGDGNLIKEFTNLPQGDVRSSLKLPVGNSYEYIEIEVIKPISSSGVTIKAAGIEWKPLPVGLHG